ncbi:MAG TPA: hypothetical protein VHP36_02875, partial [Chitinispirillaceae bacterium]|nr:hypothetical protein [Chitinispirillaceae bacterium]
MISLESQKISRLLEIIERNKWDVLRKETEKQEEEELESPDILQNEDLNAKDVKLALYSAPSPLTDSLIAMLSHETVVSVFEDPERLISFCNKHQIKFVM